MTRLRCALVLAAAISALAPSSAGAYGHLSEAVGSQVLPQHWRAAALPIAVTVDNGPTNILAEATTALGTWNAIPTAQDVWGAPTLAPVDFDKNNYGTAWGDLSGDGQQEVVFDEDGTAITALGFEPAAVNGYGPSHGTIHNGEAELDDMFLIINGSRTNFDRQSTEVHELGHTLGLAHSTVGFAVGKDGALSAELESQVPTMHPYSIVGNERRTLEADDRASLSELYPTGTFTTTTGTITGTVTRCGTGDPVLGANVRAISTADPTVQLTRITGFDGKTDGSYTMKGVPPGEYDVVVEPLAGDDDFLVRVPTFTRVDTDFTQEYLDANENDCAQDTDPNTKDPIQVGASGTKIADLKVEGASLALVIDITGSIHEELTGIKLGLDSMISALEAAGTGLPKTTIVTFRDDSQIKVVSRDPDRLREVINNLTTASTPDCPEGSNRALMTAGRLLGTGGRAILVTDADSHRTGPSRQTVEDFYRSKGLRLSTLLSGSCPPNQNPLTRARALAPPIPPVIPGAQPDEAKPIDALGVENAVRTFSEESLVTGGLFSFQDAVKTATADATTRYANTLANLGISAVRPAVAALNPGAVPQGTGLDVELTGSNTGFRAGSTVAVAGAGVSATAVRVLSPTRIVVHLTAAPGAALGFRDVTVSTNRGDGTFETAKGIGAVQVTGPPASPTILSVTPSVGPAGATEDVTISGGLTHFAAGTSAAGFGAGVTVNHVTVTSPTSAVANVTVAPGATVGFRSVTVQTGGELAGEPLPGPFLVTAAAPALARLTGANPRAGVRGATVDVALTGADTAFANGTSLAWVSGTGVQVLSTTVSSPTSAVARLKIAPNAPLGFRDLKVTTGAQDAALLDGFEVTPVKSTSGGPTTCTDRARPKASFLKGKQGASAKKGKLRLRGRASDAGCVADIPVAGRVARVEVAISRKASKHRCRFVAASGKLTGARKCSKPLFLKAKGSTSWSLTIKRKLPRGTYTLQVRARDAAGNLQAGVAKRTQRVG